MATCGDLTTVVLALALAAIRRSKSGLIVWSSAATTYHDGFCFQATWLVTPLKTFGEVGCWTQNHVLFVSRKTVCKSFCHSVLRKGQEPVSVLYKIRQLRI